MTIGLAFTPNTKLMLFGLFLRVEFSIQTYRPESLIMFRYFYIYKTQYQFV